MTLFGMFQLTRRTHDFGVLQLKRRTYDLVWYVTTNRKSTWLCLVYYNWQEHVTLLGLLQLTRTHDLQLARTHDFVWYFTTNKNTDFVWYVTTNKKNTWLCLVCYIITRKTHDFVVGCWSGSALKHSCDTICVFHYLIRMRNQSSDWCE